MFHNLWSLTVFWSLIFSQIFCIGSLNPILYKIFHNYIKLSHVPTQSVSRFQSLSKPLRHTARRLASNTLELPKSFRGSLIGPRLTALPSRARTRWSEWSAGTWFVLLITCSPFTTPNLPPFLLELSIRTRPGWFYYGERMVFYNDVADWGTSWTCNLVDLQPLQRDALLTLATTLIQLKWRVKPGNL